MGLSQVQGCCHFCKHHLETQQHLFYNCKIIFSVIHNIQTLIFEEDDITFVEKSMILGYDNGTEKSAILWNILYMSPNRQFGNKEIRKIPEYIMSNSDVN